MRSHVEEEFSFACRTGRVCVDRGRRYLSPLAPFVVVSGIADGSQKAKCPTRKNH